jgi:hypothetical protein
VVNQDEDMMRNIGTVLGALAGPGEPVHHLVGGAEDLGLAGKL